MNKDRLKFRVWNKEENIMHYEAEETYDCLTGNPIIYKSCFGDLLEDDRYIIEQCTEKKDRNGKLVYEGDIIKIGTICAPVIWNDGWYLKFGDFLEPFWHFNFVNHSIIGNIHENPELME